MESVAKLWAKQTWYFLNFKEENFKAYLQISRHVFEFRIGIFYADSSLFSFIIEIFISEIRTNLVSPLKVSIHSIAMFCKVLLELYKTKNLVLPND